MIIFFAIFVLFVTFKAVRYFAYYCISSKNRTIDAPNVRPDLPVTEYYANHNYYYPPMDNSEGVRRLLKLTKEQYLDPISHRPWIFNSHFSRWNYFQIEAKCFDGPQVIAYSQPLNIFGDRLIALNCGTDKISGEEFYGMRHHNWAFIDPVFQALFHEGEQSSYFMRVSFDPKFGRR